MESFPSTFQERFELAGEVSAGTENVYRAIEKGLDRQVAVKFIAPDLLSCEENRKKFINEGNTLASVRHPNLVEVFDVDANEERPFIVCEYIDGFSLKEEIKRMGIVPVRHACNYMLQICQGLSAIHEHKLIHRNLKPRNILIDRLGVAKILDFGFVIRDGSSAVGDDGAVLGTPAYMSPEQARGKNIGVQTDVYAAGVVFFEMLTGSTPFWGDDAKAVMKSHVRDKVPSLKDFNPLLPEKLRGIVYRMLNKDLKKRYDTINKVIRDLNAFLADTSWQKEIGEARKVFVKNEEDPSYKGVKGAIGSRERIKAARSHIDKQRSLRKLKKKKAAKKVKLRQKVAWLRTGFVVVVLVIIGGLVIGDKTSLVKLKNLLSFAGIGQDIGLSTMQHGRKIIVTWRTDTPVVQELKVLSPVQQLFPSESGGKLVTDHVATIAGAFNDGDIVTFVVLSSDGTHSQEYSHTFQYVPLISHFRVDGGVTNAFIEVVTVRDAEVSVKIKSTDTTVSLFPGKEGQPVGKKKETVFFASRQMKKNHAFSVPNLPAGVEYKATVTVSSSDTASSQPLIEEKSVLFTTSEPEYSEYFVVPSGQDITGTPLVFDESVFVSCSKGMVYAVSLATKTIQWKMDLATKVFGAPAKQGKSVVLNTGDGYTVLSADGKLIHRASGLQTKFVFKPAVFGEKGVVLVEDTGMIICFDDHDTKQSWAVNNGRTILCSPLVHEDNVYIVDSLGFLSCRVLKTGREKWNYRTGNKITATPSAFGKYILLPSLDGHFYAVYNSRGVVSWRKTVGDIRDSVTLVSEKSSASGLEETYIYLLATNKGQARLIKLLAKGGATVWEADVDGQTHGSPVLAEGRVYTATRSGTVCCFSAVNGLRLWKIDTGAEIKGNIVTAEGYIFAVNTKGALIRIAD